MFFMIALLTGVTAALLSMMFASQKREGQSAQVSAAQQFVQGLSRLDVIVGLVMIGLGLVWFFAPAAVQAAGLSQEAGGDPYASIAAAIAVGLGSLGAAYAVGTTGAAAIGVIAEKPETFGRVLIFVGLAEGIAIYGLLIAFMILNR